MKNRRTTPQHRIIGERRTQSHINIIDIKIMVHTSAHQSKPYFTMSIGKTRKAPGYFETKKFFDNQKGRYMVQNLIEALTQDDVLTSISPVKTCILERLVS